MELRLKVEQFLREHHVATLATAVGDEVWAAAVFYVSQGSTLYFLSSPTSRHCKNLTLNARVAVTIQKDYKDWPAIQGIQLEAHASEIEGAEAALAHSLYAQKFPLVGQGQAAQAPSVIAQAMSKAHWYKVLPSVLYLVDNTAGFGHREVLVL